MAPAATTAHTASGVPAGPTAVPWWRRPLSAVALVAAAVVAWLVWASGGPPPLAAPTGVDPPPAAPEVPSVLGNDAVARGTRFLVSLPVEETVEYTIVLDLLDRKFGADWAVPHVEYARWMSARPGGEQMALFRRVVDPGAHLPAPPDTLTDNSIDQLTTPALHCDTHPLPDDYLDRLDAALASRTISEQTHGTIATIWATEHGCLEPATAERLRITAGDTLVQAIRQQPAVHDQFVEAVALLYWLGMEDRVDPAWVQAIRDAQRPDGGWAEEPEMAESSGHTTVLALWVLLEAADPDTDPVTWIRRPGPPARVLG